MSRRTRKRDSDDFITVNSTKKRAIDSGHYLEALQNYATQLRLDSIRSTAAANSGHPTTCSSIAEIMAVLFFDPSGMRYHPRDPKNFNNDKLVLSKGHAAPILYAAWANAGLFPREELLNLRKLSSDLEGHPTPRLGFVDVATGSLGQGLSAACGLAYSMKYFEGNSVRVYTILGDGEMAEGGVWEAMNFAAHYQLGNMVAFIDVNRLGQSEPTMFEHRLAEYKNRISGFGWNVIAIDGHNLYHIIQALDDARLATETPTAIVCKTFKGRDLLNIEDLLDWHGKPLGPRLEENIKHLEGKLIQTTQVTSAHPPTDTFSAPEFRKVELPVPNFDQNAKIATRQAYGLGLKAIGHVNDQVVALDGDTKNSTFSINFKEDHPQRFVECFIAEQNMTAVALGLSCRGKIPFASTFAAFWSRAFDHIRLIGLSFGNVKLCGSHCGVSIGADGGSQMGLEDLAMFRTVPGSAVIYPSDAVSCYRAVELAANYRGLVYIRTSRPAGQLLYENSHNFELGKSYVLRKSEGDQLTLIGAGVTCLENLKAYDILHQSGVNVRVIDLFSVKPIDYETILRNAKETQGKILTVEDHYQAGGIFEAVSSAMAEDDVRVWGLFIREIPRSGEPDELLELFGISASKICDKVREIIQLRFQ